MLEIDTLGELAIRRDGQAITTLAPRKAEALLVYLACTGRAHAREVLAELLWDERSQEQALTNLRKAIAGLRRELAPYLAITRRTIGLTNTGSYRLDLTELEAGLRPGREGGIHTSDHSISQAQQLEQTLALYRGDFLAGFYIGECQGFEEWMLAERERLRRQVIEGLHSLTDIYLISGSYSSGIRQAEWLLQLDPLREEAHRQMMTLLARMGQRSEALAQYERCRVLLSDELGVEPEQETTALYDAIRAGTLATVSGSQVRPASPVTVSTHNLPPQLTPFIGRRAELAHIAERLADKNCRLLTIVGVGGIGKTRLALEAAEAQVSTFMQGVFFIYLAPVASPDLLAAAILSALKDSTRGEDPPEAQLLHYLSGKHLLLVLDNFEHLMDASGLLSQVLVQAPQVKILVTSRERLNLQEEWVLALEGLPFPESQATGSVEGYDAVQLFVQRARRVQANFSIGPDVKSVVAICKQVEGMPLALELAATWLRAMSCQGVASQVESGLDLFAASLRNVPERHRSLRAVFEQSWRLLSEPERTVLTKLSVFRGGFDLAAAAKVAGASLPALLSLVDKSLVRLTQSGRYDIHELLRQYSLEQLEVTGKANETRQAHCAYYADFLQVREKDVKGLRIRAAVDAIDADFNNVEVALAWMIAERDLEGFNQVIETLYRYGNDYNHTQEIQALWRQALAQFAPQSGQTAHPTWGRLVSRGVFIVSPHPVDARRAAVERALELARTRGDIVETAFSLWANGLLFLNLAKTTEALASFEEALTAISS